MRDSRGYTFLSLFLAVMLATLPVWADAQAALLRAQGNVLHNGSAVERTAAVFEGDRLETGAEGSLALTAAGSTVLVPAGSSVVYGSQGIEVLCGSAIVRTSAGMSARAGNLAIVPATPEARFQVAESPDSLRILAVEGDLSVSDGQRAQLLRQGEMMEAAGGCFSGSMTQASARSAVPASAPVPAPASSSASSAFISQGATVALILVGVAAATAAAVAVAVTVDDETGSGF